MIVRHYIHVITWEGDFLNQYLYMTICIWFHCGDVDAWWDSKLCWISGHERRWRMGTFSIDRHCLGLLGWTTQLGNETVGGFTHEKSNEFAPEVSKAMLMINFLPSWERQLLRSPLTNCALVQGRRARDLSALRVPLYRIFRQNWSGSSWLAIWGSMRQSRQWRDS